MRTTFTLTCFLLFAISAAFSQNWRLFDPAREYYYGASEWRVSECLRIDSVNIVANDTVFFPSRRLQFDHYAHPDSCTALAVTYSEFGDRIFCDSTGAYQFQLNSTNTYSIETRPSGPWTVFTNPGNSWPTLITADSFYYGIDTVFGAPDSVLNIVMNYQYPFGTVVQTKLVKVSKNHGALNYPFLDNNPTLLGISNPNIGVANIPRTRFFTMQQGDTIQVYDEYYDGWGEFTNVQEIQDVFLQRLQSLNGDTLFFQIDRSNRYRHIQWITTTIISRDTIWDTIPINDPAHLRLDRAFGEIWSADLNQSDWVGQWRMRPNFPGRLMKPTNIGDSASAVDFCLFYSQSSIMTENDGYYMDGLSGPYYDASASSITEDFHYYRYPTFAHIGAEIIGTRIDFDTVMTTAATPMSQIPLTVFPNPARDLVNIDLSHWKAGGSASIQLLNLNGQVVRQQVAFAGTTPQMQLSDLPRGLYFLQVHNTSGMFSQRLILH